jgi:large subunit ribosomal protein L20
MRVKRGVKAKKRRKSILEISSGFVGRSGNTIRHATQRAEKSLQYQYKGRKMRKRDMRALWITRINAAARECGISYSKLIQGLNLAKVEVNRKMLAELGARDLAAFRSIAEVAKGALA